MSKKKILGIDIGGTGTKGAIIDLKSGELLTQRVKIPTPKPSTPEAVAKVVAQLVNDIGYDGELIGCGFPAIIKKGVCYTASNIHEDWKGTNVQKLLSEATGRRVLVTNDADAAGISEMKYGAGKGVDGSVLLITIGTGLGTALFTDGKLVRNTEFGHAQIHGMVAEKYISNRARKEQNMGWDEFGKRFNEFLHLIDRLCSPGLIILGGGISKRYGLFSEHIDVRTKVKTAMMFNHAGIIGAALYAYNMDKKNS